MYRAKVLLSAVCATCGTERHMKMHMKHEHGDAHLCVCVCGVVGDVGRGESRRISPAPKLLLLSKCSRKGGSKCFIHRHQNTLMPST